jgi:hypothetical protein
MEGGVSMLVSVCEESGNSRLTMIVAVSASDPLRNPHRSVRAYLVEIYNPHLCIVDES